MATPLTNIEIMVSTPRSSPIILKSFPKSPLCNYSPERSLKPTSQLMPIIDKSNSYQTPKQSPRENIARRPCKRIRLDSIPLLMLPPPFEKLENFVFTEFKFSPEILPKKNEM